MVRRLLWAGALCLTLSLVTFIIFYVIPTNQVQVRGGGFTDLRRASQLNGSIVQQYDRCSTAAPPASCWWASRPTRCGWG